MFSLFADLHDMNYFRRRLFPTHILLAQKYSVLLITYNYFIDEYITIRRNVTWVASI